MSAKRYVRELTAVDETTVQGAQKEVLDAAMKQLGFIPNMYGNMANAPAVLSTYLHGYGLFRSESGFSPAEQEVVFLAVSRVNGCHYCTAAHSMIADKVSGVPKDVLAAIRSRQPIPNPRLDALHELATNLVLNQGRPDGEVVTKFLAAGFTERQMLYVVLAIAVKTLSNYTNHAFDTEVDVRFAKYAIG